jgi:hypothetical protein
MQRPADGCCNCPPGSGILANPVIERIARPTSDEAGRRVPSMRFGDPRAQALAGCLAVWDHAVSGITNKSLRAWMTGLRGVPYTMSQASYDLARLRGNGLIERIARTNTYQLTGDGLTFALVYSRVHDQVLYPLTAHDQPIAPRPGPRRLAGDHPTYRRHRRRRPARARGLNPCEPPRVSRAPDRKLGSTVKVLAPQSARDVPSGGKRRSAPGRGTG